MCLNVYMKLVVHCTDLYIELYGTGKLNRSTNFNNRKLLLKLLRRFILVGLFRIHLFGRVLAFIRYIGVQFTFGLLDFTRYSEDFVISMFVISRFCSRHITVTLAGLKNIVGKTQGLRYRGSTVYTVILPGACLEVSFQF